MGEPPVTITSILPPLFLTFILTVLFSFVIGLELHSYRRTNEEDLGFGTTRTLTLSGIAGFVFSILDPSGMLYIAGFLALSAFLLVHYRSRQEKNPSLIPPMMAILTYAMGPIALREPLWFIMVYVVVILLILGESHGIRKFSDAVTATEVVTLAKFLIMAGIILPFLPERPIGEAIPVTYTQLWLAVVMVSGVSYLSYLARTYFFPHRGILLTGTLGGLYSSTVATIVLARKDRDQSDPLTSTAIILASTMMYLRMAILVLALGPGTVSLPLLLPYGGLFLLSLGAAWGTHTFSRFLKPPAEAIPPAVKATHPLEVRTAVLFAGAFVFFAAITHLILGRFGANGLPLLSIAVGFTDITPFILSLLAGNFHVAKGALEGAIILASGSNNLVNGLYALSLARNRNVLPAFLWLATAFLLSLLYALLLR
jgi:uncharacterized membrane protein (DUF4010 family)